MSAYENFAKVKALIEDRRNAAIATADMRNEEVRSRSSVIREIDDELKTTGPKILAAACAGEDLEPIKKRNDKTERRNSAVSFLFLSFVFFDITVVVFIRHSCSSFPQDSRSGLLSLVIFSACSSLHASIFAWFPDIRTSGTQTP